MGGYTSRKHLVFHKRHRKRGAKTDTWVVRNRDTQYLGMVVYRPGWRRYVLRTPADYDALDWDKACCRQMADFLEEQTAKLRATWKKPNRKAKGA